MTRGRVTLMSGYPVETPNNHPEGTYPGSSLDEHNFGQRNGSCCSLGYLGVQRGHDNTSVSRGHERDTFCILLVCQVHI